MPFRIIFKIFASQHGEGGWGDGGMGRWGDGERGKTRETREMGKTRKTRRQTPPCPPYPPCPPCPLVSLSPYPPCLLVPKAGKVIVNTLPSLKRDRTVTLPSIPSTSVFTIDNPKPQPPVELVRASSTR